MDRYVVFGHPVGHSLSPRIHAAFAQQTGEALVYDAVDVTDDDFDGALRRFRAAGGRGANVTVPFKERACAAADQLDDRARLAGAANTLWWDARTSALWASNTDGVGLVRDLRDNLGCDLAGLRIAMVGAGGAAAGVLGPLLGEQPATLQIVNRTPQRALTLARRFQELGPVSACALADLGLVDVLINATSASLDDAVPALPAAVVGATTLCYDMMYAVAPTAFLRWCIEQDAQRVHDGIGMLVEQAAEAFALWRGVRPDTAAVLQQLRPDRPIAGDDR